MNNTPHEKPPSNPKGESNRTDDPPSPSEVQAIVLNWLRHYWDAPRHKAKWTEGATVILTLLIAVAAFWSAWTFQEQLTEARKATEIGIESFRIDERAWIEIQPMKPILMSVRDSKLGASFRYEVYVKNIGKTAAFDVEIRSLPSPQSSIQMGNSADAVSSIQDKLLLGKFGNASDMPTSNPGPRVLAPNTVSTVPFPLSGQEPQILSGGEWVSYLIGRIDYRDAFGVKHWSKFCFFVANGRGELWTCKEGNDEDHNPETPAN